MSPRSRHRRPVAVQPDHLTTNVLIVLCLIDAVVLPLLGVVFSESVGAIFRAPGLHRSVTFVTLVLAIVQVGSGLYFHRSRLVVLLSIYGTAGLLYSLFSSDTCCPLLQISLAAKSAESTLAAVMLTGSYGSMLAAVVLNQKAMDRIAVRLQK